MHVLRSLPVSLLLGLATVATGCARSAGGGGGDKASEALSTAQEARVTATSAQSSALDLGTRMDAAETTLSGHETRLGAAEGSLTDLETEQGLLTGRVDVLEAGGAAGTDDGVSVDDAVAAGFVAADNVTNVEQGFSVVNGKLTAQTTRIDTLETDFATNLTDTVVQTVNAEIANGNINATVDVAFTPPAVDTDPREDNADAVPEYAASSTLQEAIMALRFANQVRFTAVATETRLTALYDGTTRSYVQEAIRVLDKDLYDVIAGNLSPALDTTDLPQDGTYDTVQAAVEDLYARVTDVQTGADPTLTTYIQQQVIAGSQPYILGPTAATSTGHTTDGTYSGLRGATGLCQAAFAAEPSAHLCTVEEAQRAISAGSYAGALADVTTWAMGDTLAGSCDGLLSNLVANSGTTLVIDLDYAGAAGTGHVAYTGTATCDTAYPVLCCR